MRLPRLQTCCCGCCPLRTATAIIGKIFFALFVLYAAWGIFTSVGLYDVLVFRGVGIVTK